MTTAQLLKAAGLRQTQARRIVLEMLNGEDRPLSHQEIARGPQTCRLDRVTLYRTLRTLEKAGLLHRVQDMNGVWRFSGHRAHPDECGGNHIHFLCLDCNRMDCMPEQALPWVQAPKGTEVFGKQLVVYGRCARCRAEADPSTPKGAKA